MKEQLLTRMIRLYGFENPATIKFAEMMETQPIEVLEEIVRLHESSPIIIDEDEE